MINWKLYVILDKTLAAGKDLGKLAEDLIKGGADVIQLRDKISSAKTFLKDAEKVREITTRFDIPFIVNDRLDIAKACGADGVHLGQEDIPIDKARSILGKLSLIGISCHSLSQAINAGGEGIDYIGLGPIFKTSTKSRLHPIGLDIIGEVKKNLDIPIVCIGGINLKNIKEVIMAGAETIALAGAIIKSNHPRTTTQQIDKEISRKKTYDPVAVR